MPIVADLEFLDSSMHYDAATAYQKYQVPGSATIAVGEGRFGANAIRTGLFGGGHYITFKRNLTECYCGAAYKFAGFPWTRILTLTNNGQDYFSVEVRNDARVRLVNGSNQPVYTSLVTVDANAWYYIELGAVITPHVMGTGGVVNAIVMLNEVEIINWTSSGDTEYNAAVRGDEYFTQSGRLITAPGLAWTCDYYVKATEFLGDIKVRAIRPNGVGPDNDWSVVGSSSWQATDDSVPNIIDYIYSHNPDVMGSGGDQTSVEMEDVDLEDGECLGIQYLVNCWKTDANVRKLKPLIISGGTTTLGAEFSMPSDPVYTHDCQDVNEDTGDKYTEAELNAIKMGVHLTA